MDRPRVAFVGPGTVGSALAVALSRAGYPVVAIAGRSPASVRALADRIAGAEALDRPQGAVDAADLVFVTVPDDAIRSVVEGLTWRTGSSAVHCSGAASIDLLDAAAAQGADVGSFHPLQTFASAEPAIEKLAGSRFAIEASDVALEARLTEMARAVGGRAITLRGSKGLYHASAVLASNALVTLLDAAASLWEDLGLTKAEGLNALLPLVRGTVSNLEATGLPRALTGPVARGDVGTIDRNLSALREHAPETAALYVELARRTIPIAEAKGSLSPEAAAVLRKRLEEASQDG
ncbi:MAG: DUF2520 domain-containing protein [Candidatus Bipolaricaulota bacterium]|nr:MAG: DUF2520 domain-containing protein [Candidatus Bipolaricaulota bacterium]